MRAIAYLFLQVLWSNPYGDPGVYLYFVGAAILDIYSMDIIENDLDFDSTLQVGATDRALDDDPWAGQLTTLICSFSTQSLATTPWGKS